MKPITSLIEKWNPSRRWQRNRTPILSIQSKSKTNSNKPNTEVFIKKKKSPIHKPKPNPVTHGHVAIVVAATRLASFCFFSVLVFLNLALSYSFLLVSVLVLVKYWLSFSVTCVVICDWHCKIFWLQLDIVIGRMLCLSVVCWVGWGGGRWAHALMRPGKQ